MKEKIIFLRLFQAMLFKYQFCRYNSTMTSVLLADISKEEIDRKVAREIIDFCAANLYYRSNSWDVNRMEVSHERTYGYTER